MCSIRSASSSDDLVRNIATKDRVYRGTIASTGIGVANALGSVGVSQSDGVQLERQHVAMRAIAHRDLKRVRGRSRVRKI